MERRKLTELEKNICVKQIKRIEEEMDHLRWLERYNDLMLGEGLWRNYREKVKEFEKQKQQLSVDILENIEKVRTMKEYMDKGVEVKEKPQGIG